MWLIPSTIRRLPSNIPAMTSSLTALALAPGVLKTGMPSCVISFTGILLVPAPQRAIALTVTSTSSAFNLCDRSSMACALCKSHALFLIS